jgi:hypothetical protein
MARHENRAEGDGQGTFDPRRIKDIAEAGGGRHTAADKPEKPDKPEKEDDDNQ